MRERAYILPTFILAIGIVILLFILNSFGFLDFVINSIQAGVYTLGTGVMTITAPSKNQIETLKKQNQELHMQLAQMEEIQADNKALRDQFAITNPPSKDLLPAKVVGTDGSIPNFTFPEYVVIDKGKRNNVVKGSVVIEGTTLIGIVIQVSDNFAKVQLVSNKNSNFSVKDVHTGALGIVKGQGSGDMEMDNVVLSDTLNRKDSVVTLGTQNVLGKGIPADLAIGTINSIDKKSSSLFQTAKIAPITPLDHVRIVFVLR